MVGNGTPVSKTTGKRANSARMSGGLGCNKASRGSGDNALRCMRLLCANTHSGTSVRRGNLALGKIKGNAAVGGVCVTRNTSSTVRFFKNAMGMRGVLTMGYSSSVFSFARNCGNALDGYCKM